MKDFVKLARLYMLSTVRTVTQRDLLGKGLIECFTYLYFNSIKGKVYMSVPDGNFYQNILMA